MCDALCRVYLCSPYSLPGCPNRLLTSFFITFLGGLGISVSLFITMLQYPFAYFTDETGCVYDWILNTVPFAMGLRRQYSLRPLFQSFITESY
ncbi:hypothetical protein L9F63_012215, partial [Diploptera punctata]